MANLLVCAHRYTHAAHAVGRRLERCVAVVGSEPVCMPNNTVYGDGYILLVSI